MGVATPCPAKKPSGQDSIFMPLYHSNNVLRKAGKQRENGKYNSIFRKYC
ncbi:Uncharacterized protein dnm_076630 [Desulfonema magnum]|uniref:Uncharacterized protein n=1 Tax=Desulfonema magnum TaxID=45655 RepID=A0A975BUN4_9BACT|nr:Uncharacterized protein dnm_076630 [Desulfonema magnum]